jgi:hypothetical protein
MGCVSLRHGPSCVFAAHILLWEREPVGNTWKDNDFSERDAQLEPDFYANAEAITFEEVPTSQMELSDEEIAAPLVSIKFDGDGLAYEEEELPDEQEPRQDRGLLEPLKLPQGMGATDAGSAFAETLARVQEMNSTSKLAAIRYEALGVGLKVSSLPSAIDFVADVCVVAKKAMSPALYALFREIYFDGYGENASSIHVAVQVLIQQKAGLAFRKAGLFPFGDYWKRRVDLHKIKEVTLIDLDEERKEKQKAARNRKRREKRAAKITTLAA